MVFQARYKIIYKSSLLVFPLREKIGIIEISDLTALSKGWKNE